MCAFPQLVSALLNLIPIAELKCSAIGLGFNGTETNCGIAHILGILLMNSYDT